MKSLFKIHSWPQAVPYRGRVHWEVESTIQVSAVEGE